MSKKFSLAVAPTFKRNVPIPVPGSRAIDVEFTFKHKTRDEFKKFLDEIEGREDVDLIMEIASGWGLEDAFDEENIDTLIQNYLGSARAIVETYIGELTSARKGN